MQEEFKGLIGSALIDSSDVIKDGKTITVLVEKEQIPEEQVLPKVLDDQAAVKRGKNLLMYDIMKLTGGLRYRRVDIIPEPETKTLYYPYWLIYYKDKKDRMRFDVLDSLSGQKEGGQIIKSVKIGLFEKHKNPENIYLEEGVSRN